MKDEQELEREKREFRTRIGDRIRIARERAGLSQEEFGRLVSLQKMSVSAIERGIASISLPTLRRICEKLSIPSDFILFGDEGMDDVQYLVRRLECLPPEDFEQVERLLAYARRLCEKQD